MFIRTIEMRVRVRTRETQKISTETIATAITKIEKDHLFIFLLFGGFINMYYILYFTVIVIIVIIIWYNIICNG